QSRGAQYRAIRRNGIRRDLSVEIAGPALGLARIHVRPINFWLRVFILLLHRTDFYCEEDMPVILRPMERLLLRFVVCDLVWWAFGCCAGQFHTVNFELRHL